MLGTFRHLTPNLLKTTIKSMVAHDALGLAAEMAYSFLLALFPFLLFLAAVAGFAGRILGFEDLFIEIMAYLGDVMPVDATILVSEVIAEVLLTESIGLLSIGILGSLGGAAFGVFTLMKALNRAYGVAETRPFWKVALVAVALAVLMAVLLVLALALYLFGHRIGLAVANLVGLEAAYTLVTDLLRWPLMVLFTLFALALVYHLAPDVRQRFRLLTPGAVVATVLWFAATAGFGFYVSQLGVFDRFYGPIGAVIVLLLWTNLSSLAILLGGELNAELQKRYDPITKSDLLKPRA
ncbi:MAG TPA: YihY/virulence factor BrkB family protein [Chloroflexota bacterium]|nr:YihY/virulence factor BrkB family protein [Chloroflexota bacterium]